MSSLFAQYKKEREGKETIEVPEGFAVYSFHDDTVYVEDIYVVPEHRDKDIAKQLLRKIGLLAKELGYKRMMGSVAPNAKGSHQSLLMAFHYGFVLHSVYNGLIYYIKDL